MAMLRTTFRRCLAAAATAATASAGREGARGAATVGAFCSKPHYSTTIAASFVSHPGPFDRRPRPVKTTSAAMATATARVRENSSRAMAPGIVSITFPPSFCFHRRWSCGERGRDTRLHFSSVDRSDGKYAYNSYGEDDEGHDEGGGAIVESYDEEEGIDDDENSIDDTSPPENDRTPRLHRALLASVSSALASLEKKVASLEREIEKASYLEGTVARANLLVSNLYRLPRGTTTAEVEDWENGGEVVELVLNTKEYYSAQEEADALFALARKLKRGSKIVGELLADTLEPREVLEDARRDLHAMGGGVESEGEELDEGTLILIQERLERTAKKTGFKSPNVDGDDAGNNSGGTNTRRRGGDDRRTKTSTSRNTRYQPNFRELISPSGLKVLVGRNRRDNDAICFQASRDGDVWMHARGCPGAHVLLCVRRGSPEPIEDDYVFAANLAAFYSDARTERRAEVTTAEPKHITKPKGAPPGAVKLRKEGRTLVGQPNLVDESLKDARERSGGAWDETGYRKLGTRAKNKKSTAAVEKKGQAKRRDEAKEKKKRRRNKQDDTRMSGFD